MNKNIFYIDDLASIRAFCTNSDKEDVYKYIYCLQQEIAKLVEDKKYLESQINDYRNTNINLIDKNKYLEQENKQLKEDYNKVVHEATEFESKVYELEERIDKAMHRIQLLQMDNEVTVRDLGLIVRDLKGDSNE